MTYADTIRTLVRDHATPSLLEQAATWYYDAHDVAVKVASNMSIDIERASCIVAAFSPRERWSVNVRKALEYSIGIEPAGLRNNVLMADASVVHGFDALKGPKTNAFARAIAGDTDAIVIDVWMCRAVGLDRDDPTITQYREISAAVREVAAEYSITARTMQALVWIIVRGSAT
jgi:hypothetical protein